MSPCGSASVAGNIALIGCRALEREIHAFAATANPVIATELLPDHLHEQPSLLREMLAQAIAGAEALPKVEAVVLVYGACGMAIAGLSPQRVPLIVPRAHDCVTLLLGSKERYAACMQADPSLYWYTPGWCRSKRMPGPDREATLRAEYHARFDPDQINDLIEMDRESLSHHSRAAYVDLALSGDAAQQDYAVHCTGCLGWSLRREPGDAGLLSDLIHGRWDEARFLIVHPGECIAASTTPDAIVKAVAPLPKPFSASSHVSSMPP